MSNKINTAKPARANKLLYSHKDQLNRESIKGNLLVPLFKAYSLFITLMIILNGITLLPTLGSKTTFIFLLLFEICLLVLQFLYLKKKIYNKFINLIYFSPIPFVYFVIQLLR